MCPTDKNKGRGFAFSTDEPSEVTVKEEVQEDPISPSPMKEATSEEAKQLEERIHGSIFNTPYVSNPYQTVPVNWDFTVHALPKEMDELVAVTVQQWSSQQVADFVAKIPGCSKCSAVFTEQVIFAV